MATTSQLLTWIELECHGWQREGPRGSRALLNEAHRILLVDETDENIVYSNGNLPYFVTQDSVFDYNCPADCWRTKAIVVDEPRNLGYSIQDDEDLAYEEMRIGPLQYYRLLNIRSEAATPSAVATVSFIGINPGATTQTFRHAYWRLPRQILSDAIQHQMPGTTDVEYLMPATMKLIDAINDHAKMEEARRYIRMELKPQIRQEKSMGEQGYPRYSRKRSY